MSEIKVGDVVKIRLNDQHDHRKPRRTVGAELVKRNGKTLWARLPGGSIIKRKIRRDVAAFLLLLLLPLFAAAAPQRLVCIHGGDSGDGGCYPWYLSDRFAAEVDPETRRVNIPRWNVRGEGDAREIDLLLFAADHPGKVRVTSTDGYSLLAAEEWFGSPGASGSSEVTMPLPEGKSVAVSIAWEHNGKTYHRALIVSDAPSHPGCCTRLWNEATEDGYRWIAGEGVVPWEKGR